MRRRWTEVHSRWDPDCGIAVWKCDGGLLYASEDGLVGQETPGGAERKLQIMKETRDQTLENFNNWDAPFWRKNVTYRQLGGLVWRKRMVNHSGQD